MMILALDLGKSKSVGCILRTIDNTHEFVTVRTTPLQIHNLLVEIAPDRLVIEVGTPAGWVHDVAAALEIAVQVANPNHEGWRWRNVKRKTDRLDALKLAQLSMVDQLPRVHMPDASTRQHRGLIHYRGKLVSRRTRIKNTIRSLVHAQGLSMLGGARDWTRAGLERLGSWARPWDQVASTELWRGELFEELAALAEIKAQLKRVEGKLDEIASNDERVARLQTIPCVGPRTAELLVAVLDDPHRFKSVKQAGSYVGLTPRQYQSGQMDRSGRISKQGHRELRRMLVEVSWLALRYNPPLRAVYDRLCHGSVKRRKIAIVAVARKLLTWAWAMLRDKTTWKPPTALQAA
ncbi:MAG: IS110 family transposase [Pirellulaceae bacterium]|jgi:transposase|nr:IS110 family transposase [Pirellulaceae bacterium]